MLGGIQPGRVGRKILKANRITEGGTNGGRAFETALEWGDQIPVGVIYRSARPSYESQLPALQRGTLLERRTSDEKVRV
jgi:hypothetical protein